jgi:hypothetical protein
MEHRIKKRALSDVVTTVLIILVAIVAVGIIGVVVKNFVTQGASQINTAAQCNALVLTPISCAWSGTGTAIVIYNRGGGNVTTLTGVKLILIRESDGTSVVDNAYEVAGELESKRQGVTISTKPSSFAVAGVITDAQGYNRTCASSQTVACV